MVWPGISSERLTIMVGADLESLVSSHDQTSLAVLLVLQQTNVARPSLFPFPRISVKLE